MAIRISNVANMVLFAAKVYASIRSGSLAIIASTLDSLLDLLSGFILWFTAFSMQTPNPYQYPIGKKRMQPLVSLPLFFCSALWCNFSCPSVCNICVLPEKLNEIAIRATKNYCLCHSSFTSLLLHFLFFLIYPLQDTVRSCYSLMILSFKPLYANIMF